MNKKVFFVAFTALACLGISARADDILSPRTVTGHGVSSDANPSCGEAPGEAEQDADQDALSQCKTAGIQRISDYTVSSSCFAHGLYGVSHASADYQCIDGTSPLDRRVVGQAESQGDCGLATNLSTLIASTQSAAPENARKDHNGIVETR